MRHEASPRNRRKALHHARSLRDELRDMLAKHAEAFDGFRFALGRVNRIINRLETEVEAENK
jgi:hypothetical protein